MKGRGKFVDPGIAVIDFISVPYSASGRFALFLSSSSSLAPSVRQGEMKDPRKYERQWREKKESLVRRFPTWQRHGDWNRQSRFGPVMLTS